MAEPLSFLTFEDVVRAGACSTGVIEACRETGVFFGTIDEVLDAFPGERERILRAANLDGNGDGDGDGYGYGDGNGDGDGDGYGYGDGKGDGNGYGDGKGDGKGYGYGDGYGYGYGEEQD